MGELGQLCLEEVIAEAKRIRSADQLAARKDKDAAAAASSSSSATAAATSHTHSTETRLTPSLIREAYRRLLNVGALPSRQQGAAPIVGIGAALDEQVATRGRLKRQVVWRR